MIARSVAGRFGLTQLILASYDLAARFRESAEWNRRLQMVEAYCLSTAPHYPDSLMSLDTQKHDFQSDHCPIADACMRSAVDEVVSLLDPPILKTKHKVPAAAQLG